MQRRRREYEQNERAIWQHCKEFVADSVTTSVYKTMKTCFVKIKLFSLEKKSKMIDPILQLKQFIDCDVAKFLDNAKITFES